MGIAVLDLLITLTAIYAIAMIRIFFINIYKVSYYETKLDLEDKGIERVKNMGFFDLFK